ncbi:hypothetical protein Lfee_2780 [Legionella feeleii]|uniref:Uncharacterized protein n=2 Tax=Legionella feeleii TaxID=453 RepID=A0A0W0THP7_9GAMM|nr:hypothetical protein Lfee_2780 [Legionella feeleii]SPX61856.1 Uncharacterised protein [Legionella feeleii]STX39485.1 Uncharacterised protein [Legionella feeleii]
MVIQMSKKVKKEGAKLRNKKLSSDDLKNISGGSKPGINVKPGANQNPAVAPSSKN